MRPVVLLLSVAGVLGAQSMTEFGAAAAGGATGAAAGKKVSDGITAIFGKVDKQTSDAAKTGKPAETKPAPSTAAAPPAEAEVPPPAASAPPPAPKPAKTLKKREPGSDQSVAKSKSNKADDPYNLVPPPPPLQRVAIGRPVEAPVRVAAPAPVEVARPALVVPPPPPPPLTVEDLRRVTPGTNREDLLKLGSYSFSITSVDNGHLAEIFRYPIGEVRVSDGVVAAVELP